MFELGLTTGIITNDTDGDGIRDCDENATEQWQIEGRDPWINGSINAYVKFDFVIENYLPTIKVWLTVSFTAEDNAGLASITVQPQGLSQDKIDCNGVRHYEYSHQWNVPLLSWNTWVSGYDVSISLADINGNGCNATAHADGGIEGMVKLILTALVSFVEEVKSLASEAISWIWEQINGLLNQALKPIYNGIELFVNGNYQEIAKLFMKKGCQMLAYGTEDPKQAMENYIKDYIGHIYLRVLEIIYTVTNVIASIASAFATLVSTLIDSVIKFCKDAIVSAICKALPEGMDWVKNIVDVALSGNYTQVPILIMQYVKAEIVKMLDMVKDFVRNALDTARSTLADIQGYVDAIIALITQFLADPYNLSLFALLNGESGLGQDAIEKIPFVAQGKAFANSVAGIVLTAYGMKRDWKAILYQYSGIIMTIVMDFAKRYLPGLPQNPSENDVTNKMKDLIANISAIVGDNLTKMLDSGINYIYDTIEKALKDIQFYKKDMVMEKVRLFLKDKVRNTLTYALDNALKIFADRANATNRFPNILKTIVENLTGELNNMMTNIIRDLNTTINATIRQILNQTENALNQQLQKIDDIIKQVQDNITKAQKLIQDAIKIATRILNDPISAAKELLIPLLKPWIPPIFLKVLVIINDLYGVFSSAVALVKYIKSMSCANIILKGIGLGTTSASLVMSIYQTYKDISEVIEEAKL